MQVTIDMWETERRGILQDEGIDVSSWATQVQNLTNQAHDTAVLLLMAAVKANDANAIVQVKAGTQIWKL